MKMTVLTARIRQALCLTSVIVASAFSLPALAAEANPALKALFEQADYWHQRSHDDLARDALQKILLVDANNPQALYLMALYAQSSGDNAEAAKWRARLSKVSPNDPLLQVLDNARQSAAIPPAQLALARQQARSGNITASLQTWRNLFAGNQPPASVAAEYYLTMAGDPTLRPQAIDLLRGFVAAHPQDSKAEVALAKALTYQDSTRREGLTHLRELASGSKEADQAMRQALLWLSPKADDAPLYQAYQQRHPQDSAVMDYYRKNVGGDEKEKGFQALNRGDFIDAQKAFETVLKANPQDSDALAGMGYAAQRRGDFVTAASYLERASTLGGNDSAQRHQQAEDARFYAQLAKAQQAMKTDDTAQALALSEPLVQVSGDKGVSAKLFRADVLRRTNKMSQAEQLYRSVLQTNADNRNAKEGLYYVLREQNHIAEANALVASLPASVRKSIEPHPVDNGDPVRNEAKQALAAGNTSKAIQLLQQGIQRFPHNGWLRLDLARLYHQQGDMNAATALMQPLFRSDASADELYAAALFASDNHAWQQVRLLLSRIPARRQNAATRELAQRANFNLQMATAQVYLSHGENAAAGNTLRALTVTPPENPVDAGNLARSLAAAGDIGTAVTVVRNNMQRGVQGNAGDYAAQISVLNQAGLSDEARAWLSRPELVARSTESQLDALNTGFVIQDADRLRENKQYAAAYDKLARALQQQPKNTDLMFAMARLYQAGKMNKEAAEVYAFLMAHDTPQQDARTGAINIALAQNNVAKARSLANGLQGEQTPARLLLMARVSDAEGNKEQALVYLRAAHAKAVGLEGAAPGKAPAIGGLSVTDNPFINRTELVSNRTTAQTAYRNVMPWQQIAGSDPNALITTADNKQVTSQQVETFNQINRMMDDLEHDTGSWLQAGVQMRSRDGESGLGKLTEFKAPLTWSSGSFGDTRVNFTATPVTLSAGTVDATNSWRFGSGATTQTSPSSQHASGTELNLSMTGKKYKLDLGSTPLGQDLSTILGGVQWSPKLTDYLTLVLTGERRAVTDSLLSYVGARDSLNGKHWGQVTKNGGSVLLSYDNGDVGFYGGAGAYDYMGENVKSNTGVMANAGAYIRPYHDSNHELKTGISISWMNFANNLSYYSYGQGGYFSPQDYVSLSFPVEWSQRYDDLSLKAGVSIGYQSYSQDRSAYYPNNPDLQSALETTDATESYYSGDSKSGIGYNVHLGADYRINKEMTIGGLMGYDTYGSYNETTAQLYFRYGLGDK